jgi:hypothetical protein
LAQASAAWLQEKTASQGHDRPAGMRRAASGGAQAILPDGAAARAHRLPTRHARGVSR